MVKYNIDDVTDDMVLARSIFLPTGELLLAAGYHLTERYKMRLKQLGYDSVFVDIPGTADIIPESVISEHVQREVSVAVKRNTEELKRAFIVRQAGIRNIRTMIRENKHYLDKYLTNSGMINAIEKVINEVLNKPSIVLNMFALNGKKSELFTHSVNVTIISLAIGRKFRFSYEEMKQLAIGAINYDLGLIALPDEIIEKTGSELTEEEFERYMQHTVYGYLMLNQNPMIAPTSAVVALQHHECQDGSGFPRKISGANLEPLKDFSRKNMIHRFSEIVAVADMYDILVTDRFGPAVSNRDAVRKLIELSGTVLNSRIVKAVTEMIPIYPVGAMFKISEAPVPNLIGCYGVIAKSNSDAPEKPQILIYETKNHIRIKPILVDLKDKSHFKLDILL